MESITQEQVQKAINAFLTSQYDKKTEAEQKQLLKAQQEQDLNKIAELNELLHSAKQKYQLDNWMEDAANRMAKQLNFGTHISKGIHPDAKGDNVTFLNIVTHKFVGTHSIQSNLIDANGNAAALPLAAFFSQVVDEQKELKISNLIIAKHPSLNNVFSEDKELSVQHQQAFFSALNNYIDTPITHERNKQMLWPIAAESNQYITVIPLYPSVLVHNFYLELNDLRFSDENKQARDDRYKKTAEHKPYINFSDIAVTQLGGTKPQNISSLMSKQGGRNYLLPSLPPKFKQIKSFNIPAYSDTIFNKTLEYRCRETFKALTRLIKTDYNNVNIRSARQAILDDLLYQILAIGSTIQQTETAGWTLDYALDYSEKLWLDPMRVELEGQEQFLKDRETTEWRKDISKRFANWLNGRLKEEIKHAKHEFADAENKEWQKEMADMIAQSQRQGQGVFL